MVHGEASQELKAQVVTDPVRVPVDSHGPDMNDLLRDIRAQYEASAKKSREDAEAWYNSKLNDLNYQVSRDSAKIKESQSELTEYRNNLSSLTAQIEALRSNKDYLERQLADVEDRYKREVNQYADQTFAMQTQLDKVKREMSERLDEYQELQIENKKYLFKHFFGTLLNFVFDLFFHLELNWRWTSRSTPTENCSKAKWTDWTILWSQVVQCDKLWSTVQTFPKFYF